MAAAGAGSKSVFFALELHEAALLGEGFLESGDEAVFAALGDVVPAADGHADAVGVVVGLAVGVRVDFFDVRGSSRRAGRRKS